MKNHRISVNDLDQAAALLLSFFAVRGFRYSVTEEGLVLRNTESFFWVLIFLLFLYMIRICLREKDRGLHACSALFGVITGIFYTLGISLEKTGGISRLWENTGVLLNVLNLFFSQAVLYYGAAFFAFRYLHGIPRQKGSGAADGFSFRQVLLFWAVLFILYLPWYLSAYPGVVTLDTSDQICDAVSVEGIREHHSAFLTLMMRMVILPVRHFTGSLQRGVGTVTMLQMLIVTFVFALTFVRIRKYLRNRLLRLSVFLWYAFYPVYGLYSVTLWKDILFSVCFLAFMLCIDSASNGEESFFRSRGKMALLLLTMTLLPLMRHNGILIVIVMVLCLLIRFGSSRKQIAVISGCFLLLFGVWKLVLLPVLNSTPIDPCHVLSVLEQQMARVMYVHHDELTQEEMEEYTGYFDISDLWNRYNPIYSDSVKRHFRNDLYREDPAGFFRSWAKLGMRYPVDYIEAFLMNNYGYWFPETQFVFVSYGVTSAEWDIEDVHAAPVLSFPPVTRIVDHLANEQFLKTPLLPLLFSRGACFWLWLFCGCYCLYSSRRKLILVVPGLALWLSILISPIYNEFRYVYGLFTALPLLLVSVLAGPREE